MSGLSFNDRDTVDFETLANRAISSMFFTGLFVIFHSVYCNRLHYSMPKIESQEAISIFPLLNVGKKFICPQLPTFSPGASPRQEIKPIFAAP
jgi:hypothetical protein